MLQYADDLAYTSHNLTSPEEKAPGLGSMAGGFLKFQYSMDALRMISTSPRTGFYIPWTRNTSGYLGGTFRKRTVADMGRRAWGARGISIGGSAGRAFARSTAGRMLAGVAGFLNPVLDVALIAGGAGYMGYATYKVLKEKANQAARIEMGGFFQETQGSLTSRQRALQAITSSHLQAKSAIGNEAMLFHR